MNIPTLDTWSPGEKVTAAKLNKNIRDSQNFFRSPPVCVMNRSGGLTITTGTVTRVPMTTVREDNDGMADITNGYMIVRTAGLYVITGYVGFVTNGTGYRALLLYGGSSSLASSVYVGANAGSSTFLTATSVPVRLAVGDLIYPSALQTSGGNLDLTTSNDALKFSAQWVGA